MAVEFQRAWRVSEKTVEQLIFRVPRVKVGLVLLLCSSFHTLLLRMLASFYCMLLYCNVHLFSAEICTITFPSLIYSFQKDVFQSDLFPDALVTWRPVMTAEEWLAGSLKTPQFESLKPEGVGALGGCGIDTRCSALRRRKSFFTELAFNTSPLL